MLKFVLLILAFMSLVHGQCNVGEVFIGCGSACEDTCDNYQDVGRICTLQCVSGCFCEGNKVRGPGGSCVDILECSPQCDINQQYGCGSECPDTCDNYNVSRSCIESCRIGCFCNQGYVLIDENSNECIHTSECPGREGCAIDEHYRICGTACPTTCDNRGEQTICPSVCVDGCFCNDGFVLHEGQCVKEDTCLQLLGLLPSKGAALENLGLLLMLASLLVILLIGL
ncbi:Zonadhesin [Oopsacas minuta]|uniref:Zonadhesin n=1 Tax=Oopsacas minuta TaxID=111878 RepID=A0AAV7K7K9_9METZ|nr:Zonadhesin [Oopsacas minuta]